MKFRIFGGPWQFNFLTFCPIHNCFLESLCPHCHLPIVFHKVDWNKKINQCYKCNKDISDMTSRLIPESNRS